MNDAVEAGILLSMIKTLRPWFYYAKATLLVLALGVSALSNPAVAQPKPTRVLFLGDSLTAGYGLPHADGFEEQLAQALRQDGQPIEIVDGGVSGDTSAGGLARLDWALGDGADAAIVELGANDGLRGIDPANTASNLTQIVDKLQARHIPVLLCGMVSPPNLGADYARQFQHGFDQLGQRSGVIYEPFFLKDVVLHPDLEQADRMHPNAAGVKIVVKNVLPFATQLLRRVAIEPKHL